MSVCYSIQSWSIFPFDIWSTWHADLRLGIWSKNKFYKNRSLYCRKACCDVTPHDIGVVFASPRPGLGLISRSDLHFWSHFTWKLFFSPIWFIRIFWFHNVWTSLWLQNHDLVTDPKQTSCSLNNCDSEDCQEFKIGQIP